MAASRKQAAMQVGLLLETLKSSTDAEAKFEAIDSLQELSESESIKVGKGTAILMATLQAYKGNSEVCGTIIEILENLVTVRGEETRIAAAANTAILVGTHENIVVLFGESPLG